MNAQRMALEEANNRAGSFAVTYEDWDDATAAAGKWTADKESENANRAVSDADVMVYLGTFNSGAASVSIPILNRANLVMISPANTWPGLTKPGNWEPGEPQKYYPSGKRNYSRVVPADDLQGSLGATWAKELGATRVYILDDAELYGKGIATIFNNTAKGPAGLQVLGHESIDPKAADYRALATKIRASNPDLIYVGIIEDNNAAKLWQDLRQVMPNVRLMGPDGIATSNWIKTASAAAQNTYVTFGGLPLDQYKGQAAEWLTKYKAKFSGDPDVYAIYGYEAARVAIDAITRAGAKDREKVREAVFNTKNYQGLLGTWGFDENGDTTLKTMSGMQVKGEKFEFLKPLG